MPEPTPAQVFEIVRAAAHEHFAANVPGNAAILADRLAAGISNGYARATPQQRTDWTSLGPEALRAAAVMVAILGLNPDPGAKEVYIYPRGGQLIVSPTPEAVRTMLRRAGYDLQIFLCGPHDADGILVHNGRVAEFSPGRQPLDWIATPATCIGARVLVVDLTTGESVLDRWLPVAIIERRRASGRGGKPWQETWDEMAVKTGQLYALKYMPKDRIAASIIEAASMEWDAATTEDQQQPARRTVTMAAPALTGPTPLPESRQLAAPPLEVPAQRPADPVPVPVTQPAPTQATRAAPTPPPWLSANREKIAALAAAMGRPAPTTIGAARALLAEIGITTPDALEPADLAAALAEATVAAAEREPSPAR